MTIFTKILNGEIPCNKDKWDKWGQTTFSNILPLAGKERADIFQCISVSLVFGLGFIV